MTRIIDLIEYLTENGVDFRLQSHTPAYSAHEVAMATHSTDTQTLKTLVVRCGRQFWMAVVQANQRIDGRRLREALQTPHIHFVPPEDLQGLFPFCDSGTMPPLGNLYGMPVIVDEAVKEQKEIVFNACTRMHSIRMAFADFERLVRPLVMKITSQSGIKTTVPQEEM